MKFSDNVQKLALLISKMRGIHTIFRAECLHESSHTSWLDKSVESAGEFFIEFSVQRNNNGWDALEWISRAVSKVGGFRLSFRDGGLDTVFGLSFIDYTHNGYEIEDREIEDLYNTLKCIIEVEISRRSVCVECGGKVEDEFFDICYDCAIKQGISKRVGEKRDPNE